ncbi:hypothetical protein KJ959_03400, partial [bacterium]|nr:hypothetical protein [bacterium]
MIVNYNINRNVGVKANGIATRVLGKKLFIEFEQGAIILKAGDERILFEGPLYYYFDQKETEYLLNKSEKYISEFLTKVIKRKGLDYCIRHLEGEYNTVIFNNTSIKIIGDRLKRREIFYSYNSTSLCVASDLEYLAKRKSKLDYDQNILALMLSSKYHYIPAGHTIYKDIYALAPDESIKYSKNGFEKNRILALKNIEEYDESKLLEYSGIFNRAVLGRVGRGLNIANSTGGWDTTYIITILVELLGKDKVVSSIYNCKFKDGKDWNIYEKIRAKKIAKHFNIRHMEVPLDFTSDVLTDNLRELLPCLRSKNIYIAPLPHFILYKGTRKWLGVKQKGTIFSGEAADSLHNFGFSQYLSFFHKSYAFKEYGDKTKNYLY